MQKYKTIVVEPNGIRHVVPGGVEAVNEDQARHKSMNWFEVRHGPERAREAHVLVIEPSSKTPLHNSGQP